MMCSSFPSSIHFWPSCFVKSRRAPSRKGTRRRKRVSSVSRQISSEKELCKEWTQLVHPELRRLFETATDTVANDLKPLNGNSKPFANCTLRIPTRNAEAWLSALNQARLVVAAKYGFSEGELSDHYRSPIGSRRDLGLFQVNFYGFLQEFILHEMRNGSAEKRQLAKIISTAGYAPSPSAGP